MATYLKLQEEFHGEQKMNPEFDGVYMCSSQDLSESIPLHYQVHLPIHFGVIGLSADCWTRGHLVK